MKRSLSDLTTREKQVAELLAWGAARKEIPDLLVHRFNHSKIIKVGTVRSIQQSIYLKWSIQKATELSVVWFSLNYNIPLDLSPLLYKVVVISFLALITPVILANLDTRPNKHNLARTSVRSARSSRNNNNTYNLYL